MARLVHGRAATRWVALSMAVIAGLGLLPVGMRSAAAAASGTLTVTVGGVTPGGPVPEINADCVPMGMVVQRTGPTSALPSLGHRDQAGPRHTPSSSATLTSRRCSPTPISPARRSPRAFLASTSIIGCSSTSPRERRSLAPARIRTGSPPTGSNQVRSSMASAVSTVTPGIARWLRRAVSSLERPAGTSLSLHRLRLGRDPPRGLR